MWPPAIENPVKTEAITTMIPTIGSIEGTFIKATLQRAEPAVYSARYRVQNYALAFKMGFSGNDCRLDSVYVAISSYLHRGKYPVSRSFERIHCDSAPPLNGFDFNPTIRRRPESR